jgi:hypothetical protein
MADKGRFEGLIVNFQALPPKASDTPLVLWGKRMAIGIAVLVIMRLLSLLI